MPEVTRSEIQKVANEKKVKFSNAKTHYYAIEVVEDGVIKKMMFTRRQLMCAEQKYTDFQRSLKK